MKLFRFRGGVHPHGHKLLSNQQEIDVLPLPRRLYVPVQQHIGVPAQPVVVPGQKVLKGELIAAAQGTLSAAVHAPTSGTVVEIGPFTAPHPSGLPVTTIIIDSDGEDRWCDEQAHNTDPFSLTPQEISDRVAAAGIVGMGGATFPSALKLHLGHKQRVHTLIINGGECEPYLTCDDRLMRESADTVIDGVRIMVHAIGLEGASIAIEDNKPQAYAAMRSAAEPYPEIRVVRVPSLYPMGSEKQMIQFLTGIEVPAGTRSAEIGLLVHNVATAHAIHEAVRFARPLVSRVVTVSGGAVRNKRNLQVPIGTLVQELFDYCGLVENPARLIMGGPMMGQVIPHTRVPVVKGTSGIIALSQRELGEMQTMPCIRCGRCVGACPVGLMPLELMARVRAADFDGAIDYGLHDCISCGSCAYVCPSHLPLTQFFNFAKGELVTRDVEKRKNDYTRKLAADRQARLQREAEEKKRAAAERKAARAAAKAAKATEQETQA